MTRSLHLCLQQLLTVFDSSIATNARTHSEIRFLEMLNQYLTHASVLIYRVCQNKYADTFAFHLYNIIFDCIPTRELYPYFSYITMF